MTVESWKTTLLICLAMKQPCFVQVVQCQINWVFVAFCFNLLILFYVILGHTSINLSAVVLHTILKPMLYRSLQRELLWLLKK